MCIRDRLYEDLAAGIPFFEASSGELNAALTVVGWQDVLDFDGDGSLGVEDIDMMTSSNNLSVDTPVDVSNGVFDLNSDGVVNSEDAETWLANAANAQGFGSSFKSGDANLDGVVDGSDFNLWNAHKFSSSDTVAVPEPPGSVLALFAAFVLLGARQRMAIH